MKVEGLIINCEPEVVHAARGKRRGTVFTIDQGKTVCRIDLKVHADHGCVEMVDKSRVTCLVCQVQTVPSVTVDTRVPELAGV